MKIRARAKEGRERSSSQEADLASNQRGSRSKMRALNLAAKKQKSAETSSAPFGSTSADGPSKLHNPD